MTTDEQLPDELELKVYNALAHSSKPKPVQSIADEIFKDYDYTLNYLTRMGERWHIHIRFHDLDDGSQAAELVATTRLR